MIVVPPRSRATWLVPCAVLGIFFATAVSSARAEDDARAWLQKMSRALAMRNYDGIFFHLGDGRV